jgi:hypothetical protein
MQKVEIDYSNTIIYKIVCKDPLIKDVYVGHTINFVQRKHAHKQACNNINSQGYNLKLYKTIRENGNWSNWDMSIINFYNCENLLKAREKEHEYYVSLNATLNSVDPLPFKDAILSITSKSNSVDEIMLEYPLPHFICSECDFKCHKKGDWKRHNNTIKHITNPNHKEFVEDLSPKIHNKKFGCSTCEFYTSNKKDWERHINTEKHINNIVLINSNKTSHQYIKEHKCKCGNVYKHGSSLSLHKKTCVVKNAEAEAEVTDKQLILLLLKQNAQLIEQNAEFVKNITATNIVH